MGEAVQIFQMKAHGKRDLSTLLTGTGKQTIELLKAYRIIPKTLKEVDASYNASQNVLTDSPHFVKLVWTIQGVQKKL